MGIADLPDIDEDEWRNYQADTFRRQTMPLSSSAAFMASTAPLLSAVDQARQQAAMLPTEPPPAAPLSASGGLGLGAPSAPNPFAPQQDGMDGVGTMASDELGLGRQPYFGTQQTSAPDLFDELTSFDDSDGEAPAYKQNLSQEKPGFFSWAGEQVGGAARGLRESGFSQTPVIGPVVTGGLQGIAGTLHGLGGSAQAIREGNLLGGIGGTVSATLNTLGDIPRGAATEAQWPEQIIPGIDPNTPVIGGLNNPRELVGLGADLLIPETALERLVGKGVRAAARPVAKAAGEALEPLGRAIGDVAQAPPGIAGRGAERGGTEDWEAGLREAVENRPRSARGMEPEFDSMALTLPDRAGRPGVSVEPYHLQGQPQPDWATNIVRRDADGNPEGILTAWKGDDGAYDTLVVAVRPDARRRGIATELYQAAENGGIDVDALTGKGGYTEEGAAFNYARQNPRPEAPDAIEGIASRMMESPFFSPARTKEEAAADIGIGTAGGIAGAATADEDATWQERLGRGVAGAGIAAMGGPIARAPSGISGIFRKLAQGEEGSLNIAGGGRQYRQNVPEGYEDLWDAMTPRQRRSARDAADEGRVYQPNVQRIEAQRAMPEAQRIQQEIADELPDMQPSDDALPSAEPAGDVTARVAGQLSPMAKEKVLEQASNFFSKKNAPWLKGMIERTAGEGGEGTERYDRILELTTGEQSVGQLIEEAADEADQGIPQLRMTKRMRERQGNLKSMENVPEFLQAQLKRERDGAVKQMVKAHGGMTDLDATRAADTIMEYIGQFAKNAKPNEPVSQVLLRAGREARAAIQLPKFLAEEEYQKLLSDPNADKATLAIAEEARDHWDYLSRVMSLYAGETAPSEIGRAFRSMRDKPRGSLSVEGGTFKPGERLPSGEAVPVTNKGKLTADEQAYQKELQQRRKDLSGVPDDGTDPTNAKRLARTRNRVAGKRPDGPMNDLGLEWSDIFRRDTDDSLQRAKMMAGLEDIGGYRMRRDWVPRMMKLDLDDEAAVKKFWTDARTAAGLDENSMPLVDFDPEISGQSYLGAADTLTKNDAMTLVNRTLIRDADTAVKTLRRLQREGAPAGDIKAAQDEVRAAMGRTGLDIESFPENQLPILASVAEGLGARIEREWPEDRVAMPGKKGVEEDVAKKRQLLGLFDQGIKKEQKLAGLPVTGIQDFLSFGTSNVLMTPRYLQAATLESAMNMINAPWQSVLRGNYGAAKQQLLGIARAFNLPTSEDLLKLGEGIKAPAMVNAMRTFTDIPLGESTKGVSEKALGIGRLQSTAELSDIANRTGFIKSDSPHGLTKFLTPMHRLTRGMSEAFQTGSYFGEVARLAKDASENGALPGGKKLTKILDEGGEFRYPSMAELYGNLPKEIVDEALRTSKVITEGGHADIIEKQFGQWKGLLNKPGASSAERTLGIFANLMFPFVYGLRPAIRMGFETATSPIAHPIQGIRALARGDKGEAAYIAKKFALASSFNGYLAFNVMGGNITGHGPNDPDARQALMEGTDEQGDPVWRPDSIRLPSPDGGHFWVKYASMPGAISMVATIMANAFEGYVYDGKPLETPPETAQRIALGVGTSFMDNTYFRDFMDLATAMNSTGGANTVQRLLGQMGGRFVPATGALRLAAQLTDPKQRLSGNVVEDVMAGIPGLRQQLPTMKSPYTGQDVEMPLNPATALGGIAGNVYGSPSEGARSPVAREVAELSQRTSLPWEPSNRPADVADAQVNPRTFTRGEQARGAEFQGLRQTPEAVRGAQAAFGRETQEDLLPLLQSPAYQALPPEQKAARIEAAMKGAASAATYEATGAPGVQLKPEAQLDRAMMGQPMFRGQDTGSPGENAALNQKIIAAQNSLAQLTQRYGRRQAIILMDEQAPEMLELALIYKRYNPDVRWMMEQESRETMGIPNEAPTDVYIPDYGGGAGATVPTQANVLTGGELPPTFEKADGMSQSGSAVGKQALAAAWALNQIGSRDYYNLCQRFVEQAYGTGGQYRSAAAAGGALNWGTDPDEADVGDLVFFKPDSSNGGAGHVGIYLGNGEMVSATNGGITRDNIFQNSYWKNLFVGFGDPPEQWKGRPATNDLISGAATLAGKAKIAVGNAIGGKQAATSAYWGAAAPYAREIVAAAAEHDVPANVLAGLLIQESGGKVNARSSAGALGLMQFMPGTARGMGIDPLDPAQAIDGGARYLKQLADQSGGDWEQAVGKYNAGPAGNLNNAETRNHIVKVMQYADTIGQGMGAGGASGGLPPSGGGRGDDGVTDTYRPARGRSLGLDDPSIASGPTMDDVIGALIQARDATGQAKDAAVGRAQALLEQIRSRPGPSDRGPPGQPPPPPPALPPLPDAWGCPRTPARATSAPGSAGCSMRSTRLLAGPVGRPRLPVSPRRVVAPWPTSSGGDRPPPPGLPLSVVARWPTSWAGWGGEPPAPASTGPGGPPPPGGGDLIDPETGQPVNRSPQTSQGQPGEIMGPAGRPAAPAKAKPNGWIDPSAYTGINRSTVETANGLLQQIQDATDELSGLTGTDAKSMIRREELQKAINDAQGRMVSLTPSLQKIEQEEAGGREGIMAPGATPYMKKVPIYKKVDGKWTVEYIDNAGAEEDPANLRARLQEEGATGRNQADIASREKISGAEIGVRREEMGSREDIAAMQEGGATERTNINATTQRVTTALAQAVEQRRQDIDAQIRKGDLDLRTATEQFNQWYKQNVEAPLAILNTKRETERLRVEQSNAVTTRATAQSAHERGVAQLGQQMYQTSADAYGKMIPLTVGAGWGEGFQKNLQGQGYTPNQGAAFNTPESMDEFATRKVAEMLKGVSPYAQSILGAEGQIGAPGPGMSGHDMTALTDQAAGVASNALSNPFQMPQQQPFQMPGQVDVSGMAGAGMQGGGGLTNEIDQYLPQLPNYQGV